MVYDVAIIGAGPGGYVAAIRGSQLGGRICLIEQNEVGGTCLQHGCIPTKALISSTDLLRKFQAAEEYGISLGGPIKPDLAKMMARKDQIVTNLTKGIKALLKSQGITLIKGQAAIEAPETIRVNEESGTPQVVETQKVIIATGSKPGSVPVLELDGVRIISSDDAVRLREIPERLLIVGAGAIGCEFAFIFKPLGSNITMVELMPQALPQEDTEIARTLERELKKNKIKLFTNNKVESLREEGSDLIATLTNGQEITADKILVSIGRAVNVAGLGLERLGVHRGPKGEISVNNRMETNIPGIYAIGDVVGGAMLAHVASAEGLVAVENALGGHKEMDYTVVPAGIFTSPEIGRVGLTEREAQEKGYTIKTGRFPLRALGKAQAMGELAGLVKLVADAQTDKLLGAHIIGPSATDLIHEAALAMQQGIPAKALAELIHSHPTLSEGIMEAAHSLYGQAIHLPREQ